MAYPLGGCGRCAGRAVRCGQRGTGVRVCGVACVRRGGVVRVYLCVCGYVCLCGVRTVLVVRAVRLVHVRVVRLVQVVRVVRVTRWYSPACGAG
ncbi:hypothetical protein [Streptomyces sp. SID1121]|uniref:hypothetical protein n=1 Tax=Streptomyces sp. SID1121 TaxID=3425888 RepID=UPI004056B78E